MAVGIVAIVIGCVAILVPGRRLGRDRDLHRLDPVIAGAFLVAAAFTAHSVGTRDPAAALGAADRASSASG